MTMKIQALSTIKGTDKTVAVATISQILYVHAVLLFISLIFLPTLHALDNATYDLPRLVRHAEIIVIGRVVQLTEISAPDKDVNNAHAVIATIAVKQTFQGVPTQQLQMIVRPQDETVVLVGHEFLFFLKSFDSSRLLSFDPWLGGRNLVASFGQFHFPHPIIPVDQDRIEITDELKGSYFANVINSYATIDTLKDIFTLIRGPLMTVTAPKAPIPWDKAWSINLRFNNPSSFPIPLLTSAVSDVPINGFIVFTDQHGFRIGSNGCSIRLTDDEQQPTVTIPAEEHLNGSVTVHEPIDYLISDPNAIRHMYVIYLPLAATNELATGWDERIISNVDVRFIDPNNDLGETDVRAHSSSLLLAELSRTEPEINSDAKDDRFEISVTANKFFIHEHRNTLRTLSPDEQTILINAIQLEQRGVVVRPAQSGPTLTALINRLVNDYHTIRPSVSVSEFAALVKPGNYNMRLILPHDNQQALSNVLQITIP